VTVLRLPPLSRGEIAEYLATCAPLGARAAEWVHRQSGGNALYVRELSRLLVDELPPQDPSMWIPVELRVVLSRRLAQLAEPVVAVLSAASILGDEFALGALEALVDHPVDAAVDAAIRQGVVILDADAPGWARFSHGLMRSALYAAVPSGRRVGLHRRAARLLEQDAAGEEQLMELAFHAVRGAATSEERSRAVAHLCRAADLANRRLAYDEAARLLRSASATARLGAATLLRRAEVELELATAEFNAGSIARATSSVRSTIELAQEAGAPDIAAAAALVVSGVGTFDTTLGPLLAIKEHAITLLPSDPTPDLRARTRSPATGAPTRGPFRRRGHLRHCRRGGTALGGRRRAGGEGIVPRASRRSDRGVRHRPGVVRRGGDRDRPATPSTGQAARPAHGPERPLAPGDLHFHLHGVRSRRPRRRRGDL